MATRLSAWTDVAALLADPPFPLLPVAFGDVPWYVQSVLPMAHLSSSCQKLQVQPVTSRPAPLVSPPGEVCSSCFSLRVFPGHPALVYLAEVERVLRLLENTDRRIEECAARRGMLRLTALADGRRWVRKASESEAAVGPGVRDLIAVRVAALEELAAGSVDAEDVLLRAAVPWRWPEVRLDCGLVEVLGGVAELVAPGFWSALKLGWSMGVSVPVDDLAEHAVALGVSRDAARRAAAVWLPAVEAALLEEARQDLRVVWGPPDPLREGCAARDSARAAAWWFCPDGVPAVRVMPAAVVALLERSASVAEQVGVGFVSVDLGPAVPGDDGSVFESASGLARSGMDPVEALEYARLVLEPR